MITLNFDSIITPRGLQKKTYWSHGHVDVVSRLTWLFCMKYSLDYFGQRAVTKYHGFIFALVGICRSKSDGEYQFHIIFQQHLSAFADGRLMRFFIGHLSAIKFCKTFADGGLMTFFIGRLSAIKFCKTFADGGLMRFFIGHLSVITIVRNHK